MEKNHLEKYRLKKLYPGSPELETEVVKNRDNIYGYYEYNKGRFASHMIENHPEFWEPVVEKDYEILSFRHKGSNHIWKKDSQLKGLFCLVDGKIPFTSLEEINKYPKVYEIYSVKRLSDGEIFTVGDKIKTSIKLTIHSFIIIDDKLLINPYEIIGTISLNKISKLKEPLFTTEDGVDIFDKNLKIFSVSECDFKLQNHQDYGWVSTRDINRKYHHFSTKEAAEEYILMNKPCLSINEVMNVAYNPTETFTSTSNKLKELVKSKL